MVRSDQGPPMATIYWEDFVIGSAVEMGRHTFGEAEIIAFARQFDPQPFHLDPEAARHSPFGGLIASGWHTCALGMRLACESYVNRALSMGAPGVDAVTWPNPVRPGDTIVYKRIVLDTRPSKSRPEMGLVKSRWEAVNQQGETVMTLEGWAMFGRRPA